MNIFVTDPDPVVAASHLDDKRVSKMILETVQMLSIPFKGPYKKTHENHPCSIWIKESDVNLAWTIEYLHCLHDEYVKRRGKQHKSYEAFLKHSYTTHPLVRMEYETLYKNKKPTNFVNCSAYKDMDDVFVAYQLTLADKWDTDKRTPTWYGVGR